MFVNETLELEYLVEQISDTAISIDEEPTDGSSSLDSIDKRAGVFNPSETGIHEVNINGQIVEIDVTVPTPVAYSNLVAWYPFDSSFYGGSDADDVTALFNPNQSGDSTAYDGTVNGATYQPTGGVTDINIGVNSGRVRL